METNFSTACTPLTSRLSSNCSQIGTGSSNSLRSANESASCRLFRTDRQESELLRSRKTLPIALESRQPEIVVSALSLEFETDLRNIYSRSRTLDEVDEACSAARTIRTLSLQSTLIVPSTKVIEHPWLTLAPNTASLSLFWLKNGWLCRSARFRSITIASLPGLVIAAPAGIGFNAIILGRAPGASAAASENGRSVTTLPWSPAWSSRHSRTCDCSAAGDPRDGDHQAVLSTVAVGSKVTAPRSSHR
jgi:hypothetical protein